MVSETVMIRLTRPPHQLECQYVETNAPPCPLHVEMFAEEIRAAEAMRAARREGY